MLGRGALIAVLTAILASCCPRKEQEARGSVIVFLPFTGGNSEEAVRIRNAMELEKASFAEKGIQLRFVDSSPTGTSAESRIEAESTKAGDDPSIVLIAGLWRTLDIDTAVPIANRHGLAVVSPIYSDLSHVNSNVLRLFPSGKRNLFLTSPTLEQEGTAAARWLKQLDKNSVYIVLVADSWGATTAKAMRARAESEGITIAGETAVSSTAWKTELDEKIAKTISESRAQLVYLVGAIPQFTERLLRSMHNADLHLPILADEASVSGSVISVAKETGFDGKVLVIRNVLPMEHLTATGREFCKAYRRNYGKEPSPLAFAAYDATIAILAAIRNAECRDRAKILDSVRALREVQGCLGKITFGEDGGLANPVFGGYVLESDQFRFKTRIE